MNDYVFRQEADGLKFVGDFDRYYAEQIDPWEQSGTTGEMAAYYTYSRARLARCLAARFNNKACGLEIGSGYGYLTELLSKKFDMSGIDISPFAVKRAQILHPGIPFDVSDITDPDVFPGQFHFVILSECWWYVIKPLDKLFTTLSNCIRALEPNGLLVLHQGFLRDKQKYGAEIAEGFFGALLLLTSIPDLRLVEAHYDDTGTRRLNHGVMLLRKIDTED